MSSSMLWDTFFGVSRSDKAVSVYILATFCLFLPIVVHGASIRMKKTRIRRRMGFLYESSFAAYFSKKLTNEMGGKLSSICGRIYGFLEA